MANTKTSGATKSTVKKVSKSSYTKKVETVIPQDDVKVTPEESFVPNNEVLDAPVDDVKVTPEESFIPNDEVVDVPAESTVEAAIESAKEALQSQDIKNEDVNLVEKVLAHEEVIVDSVEATPEGGDPVASVFSPKPLAPKAKVTATYGATKFC